MNYTIEKIENGIALMRYEDGSYANITLESDMTPEQVDDIAFAYAPKTGTAPDNIAVGHTRVAQKMAPPPESESNEEQPVTEMPEYLNNRVQAYGDLAGQIEYITENGLEAWQAHVAEIKAQYPEPTE